MDTVGIRELKAQLSRHLRRVRSGARLLITDRGRSIATISPVEPTADVSWASRMVAEGRAQWGGGKPAGSNPRVSVDPDRTVSTAVLDDRR